MDLLQAVKNDYVVLKRQRRMLEKELSSAPPGRLSVQKRGATFRWYREEENRRLYIPKAQKDEAEKLAYKTYLLRMLSEIDQKLLAYEAFLKKYPARCGREALLLEESPGIRELLLPQLLKLPDDLELWAREEYDKNMDYPDHLKYPTIRGELVRSKSETQISYVLAKNSIPYRYECRLPLDGVSIYPDFTTLRPFDRKIIIWEHFGLLDKPAYIDNTTSKLNLYIKNGWIPGNNLIITTETEKYPLDIRQIEELVKFHYFPG